MLNYIWAGLIIISLVFALVIDIGELRQDRYRVGEPLPVTLHFPDGYDPQLRRVPVHVLIDPATYRQFYETEATPDSVYTGELLQTVEGRQLRFAHEEPLPEPLLTIRNVTGTRDDLLRAGTGPLQFVDDTLATTTAVFDPVRFVRVNAISSAALDFADTAASLALGLIGVLALFLGLLKIAEAAGIIYSLVKVVQPVMRPLFPSIPKDHPAMGMIVLNLAANVFGLGNAATPLGIKAMEELQKINPVEGTASNAQVMLLALNTSSVQLVPPVLLIAVMGLQINQLFFSITMATLITTIAAILVTKFLERLPGYRRSDPHLAPESDAGDINPSERSQ